MCIWSVTALALLRYGVRSLIARLGGVLAVLFSIGSCCMWAQRALWIVPLALAVVLALVLFDPQGRRALGSIALTGGVFWCAFMLFARFLSIYVNATIGQYNAGTISVFAYCGYAATLLTEACVLSQSRRWLRLT
jgi:hypothetical protein